MSIFGKKPNGPGSENDPQKAGFDVPDLEKYSYQTQPSAPKTQTQSPQVEPPQVHRAAPPTMSQVQQPAQRLPQQTQAPSMPQNATIAPSGRTTPPGSQREKETAPVESQKSPYSIDDVIRLMRELPDSKKEMVVVIVQKTLLSARIDVGAIIDDAARKVDRLNRQNDGLVAEIRNLEEAIIQKKAEVDRLTRELDETNSVKHIFEATYGRHVRGDDQEKPAQQGTLTMKL